MIKCDTHTTHSHTDTHTLIQSILNVILSYVSVIVILILILIRHSAVVNMNIEYPNFESQTQSITISIS